MRGKVREPEMLHLKDSESCCRKTRQPEAKKCSHGNCDNGKRSKGMWCRLSWCQLSPARPIIKLWWTHHMTTVSSAYIINKCKPTLNGETQQWSNRQMQGIYDLIGLEIDSTHTDGGLSVVLVPVPPEHPGQVSLGKPHGDGAHEHPENGQLIQHLTKEAEGGVKIRWTNTWEKREKERFILQAPRGGREMRRSKVSCPKAGKVSNFVERHYKHFREVSLDGAAASVRVLLLSQPNKSSIVCLICWENRCSERYEHCRN